MSEKSHRQAIQGIANGAWYGLPLPDEMTRNNSKMKVEHGVTYHIYYHCISSGHICLVMPPFTSVDCHTIFPTCHLQMLLK